MFLQHAAAGVSRLSTAAQSAREKQKAEMLGMTALPFARNGCLQLRFGRQTEGSRKFFFGIIWIEVIFLFITIAAFSVQFEL